MRKNIVENSCNVNSFTTFKPVCYGYKKLFQTIKVSELPAIVSAFEPGTFRRGITGVYIKTCLTDQTGKKAGIWPVLDIEHPDKHHHDLAANIETAKNVFISLNEAGLTDGLHIMPTGTGFRFCWPFIIPQDYVKPFKAFLNDIYGVDTGTLKPSQFTRLFAYRGHKKQDRKQPDIHTHMLPVSDDLFGLTPERYQRIVAGHISRSDALEWLNRIIPAQPMPRAWVQALGPVQDYLRLKNSMIRIPTGGRNRKYKALPSVLAYLDGLGIRYEKPEPGAIPIYRLSECPECGRKDANPYITPSGYLKHWTQSCRAGERDDHDRPKGLAPHEWIPGFEYVADNEAEPDRKITGIEDARQMMADAVSGSADDLLIIATPGSGKTYTTLQEYFETARSELVIYAAPTVEKAQEELTRLKGLDPGINLNLIRGRYYADEDDYNCEMADECNRAFERGYMPGAVVCPKCALKGTRFCKYNQQFDALNRPGMIFTTHDMGVFLRDAEPHTIIWDEDPSGALLKEKHTDLGSVTNLSIGSGAAKSVFEKMVGFADDEISRIRTEKQAGKKISTSPFYDAGQMLSDNDKRLLSRHLDNYLQREGETDFSWQRRLWNDQKNINLHALSWLLTVVEEMPGRAFLDLWPMSEDSPVSFSYIRHNIPNYPDTRFIVLDGTGHKEAVNSLFGHQRDFREINAQVSLNDCSFEFFRRGLGKTKAGKLKPKQIEKILGKISIRHEEKKILIATHKAVEKAVSEAAKAVFPGKQVDPVHFAGNRGKNKFKSHDIAICFGTMKMNPRAATKRAYLLFPGQESVQADFIRHLSDAENLQTLHRVRPVNGGKRIVIMSYQWPGGLPKPDIEHDLRPGKAEAFETAYERVKAFYETFGYATKDSGWFVGVGCQREKVRVDVNHRHWLEIWKESPGAKKSVFCLIRNSLLGKRHLFLADRQIIMGSSNYWNQIMERLKTEYPGIGSFETCQTDSGQWSKGVGNIEKVRALAEALGRAGWFEPDKWRQTEPETLAEDDTGRGETVFSRLVGLTFGPCIVRKEYMVFSGSDRTGPDPGGAGGSPGIQLSDFT